MDWLASIFPFGVLTLACPLIMLLMLRGMFEGGHKHKHKPPPAIADADELRQLQREVAALRKQLHNPS